MATIESNITTIVQDGTANAVFDRVLACALGEATESVRLSVEQMLRDGHAEYVSAQGQVQAVLGSLPSVLPPITPPAFIKDRVMSQVAMSASQQHLAESITENAGRFTKSFSTIRRSMVFSGLMLIGGIVISGYAVDQLIQGSVEQASAPQIASISRIDGLKGLDAAGNAERNLTVAQPIVAPPAEVATTNERAAATATHAVSTVTDGYTGHMQTNFGLTQAYLYLTSSPGAMEYSLKPINSQVAGEGRVLWDEKHGDALLVVSKLQPTNSGSHYVLWYLRDGMTPERMLNFNAASGTPMSFFINHAPSDRVKGVMLTVERNVQGRTESQEVLKAALKENLHS